VGEPAYVRGAETALARAIPYVVLLARGARMQEALFYADCKWPRTSAAFGQGMKGGGRAVHFAVMTIGLRRGSLPACNCWAI